MIASHQMTTTAEVHTMEIAHTFCSRQIQWLQPVLQAATEAAQSCLSARS